MATNTLNRSDTIQVDMTEELKFFKKEAERFAKEYRELLKWAADKMEEARKASELSNPYAEIIEEEKRKREALNANADINNEVYGKNALSIAKWRVDEFGKIQSNTSLSAEQKNEFVASLDEQYKQKIIADGSSEWLKKGEKIGDMMSKTLDNILNDVGDFDVEMKKLSRQLLNYLIKETMGAAINSIFNAGGGESSILGSASKGGLPGALANIGIGFIKNLFGKHHSGGVIPSAAGYSLTGTQEQLAILKGGERVLSPGENVQYESGSDKSNVNFVNLNVKAWDSKDVSKYLMENKNLIHSMMFEGIQYNNCHLRNLISNL
jgi:hypothetical protein